MADEEQKKRSRDSWTQEQTDLLLQLVKEKDIIRKMDTKRYRKENLFNDLVPIFREKNIEKTGKQIREKYDNLKSKIKVFYFNLYFFHVWRL